MSEPATVYKQPVPDNRRDRILHVAFTLFATQGYAQTSVDRIAREANLSKGLIYHYFESKEAILKMLFDQLISGSGLAARFDPGASAEAYLQEKIEHSFGFIKEHTAALRLVLALSVQPEVLKGLRKQLDALKRQITQDLKAVFTALNYADPEVEAYQLCALFDGAGLGYITLEDYPLESIKQSLKKRYGL